MAHIAAAPDGTFVVAGTRAIEEVSAFQVFLQRLDADGLPSEPTIEPSLQPGFAHTEPRIAVGEDGVAHLAWSATEDFSTYQVDTFSLPPGDDGSLVPVQSLGVEGDHAAVAATGDRLWGNSVDEPTGRGIRVRTAPDQQPLSFGDTGRFDHSPALAFGQTHAAVAWHRLISGTSNEVVIARIEGANTNAPVAGPELVLPDVEAAPYPVTLTPVGEDIYLVAWSQGANPDFIVYGRFIDLGR